jgi:hypothetical protein
MTVDVSEDDLRTLAERGYEGAASTDQHQQAQAVGLFVNDTRLTGGPRSGTSVPRFRALTVASSTELIAAEGRLRSRWSAHPSIIKPIRYLLCCARAHGDNLLSQSLFPG